jgi:hypothetical protein
MIQYLRIPKNKFWGWVFTSLAVGLVLGVGVTYALGRSSSAKQIEDLKQQLESQASEAASTTASLQSKLQSSDASLTAVSQQYAALKAEKDSADQSASGDSTSSSTAKLEVLSRKVSPSTVATGDDLTLTAVVQGKPDKVTVRVYRSASDFDETYSLKKVSSNSKSQTWRKTISAPKKTGTYTYYATAYLDGKSATMPGASPSTFKVE